jgi:hypothetical protein
LDAALFFGIVLGTIEKAGHLGGTVSVGRSVRFRLWASSDRLIVEHVEVTVGTLV